jgi:pimeloyl-ACP methyl ester carboxylesterase
LPLTCAATTCPRQPDDVHAYDTDKLTDDIRDLVHERGAESALLVGHDWGGTVAWDTAMSHPEVMERLAGLALRSGPLGVGQHEGPG